MISKLVFQYKTFKRHKNAYIKKNTFTLEKIIYKLYKVKHSCKIIVKKPSHERYNWYVAYTNVLHCFCHFIYWMLLFENSERTITSTRIVIRLNPSANVGYYGNEKTRNHDVIRSNYVLTLTWLSLRTRSPLRNPLPSPSPEPWHSLRPRSILAPTIDHSYKI